VTELNKLLPESDGNSQWSLSILRASVDRLFSATVARAFATNITYGLHNVASYLISVSSPVRHSPKPGLTLSFMRSRASARRVHLEHEPLDLPQETAPFADWRTVMITEARLGTIDTSGWFGCVPIGCIDRESRMMRFPTSTS
jgi:hypothetical protein